MQNLSEDVQIEFTKVLNDLRRRVIPESEDLTLILFGPDCEDNIGPSLIVPEVPEDLTFVNSVNLALPVTHLVMAVEEFIDTLADIRLVQRMSHGGKCELN